MKLLVQIVVVITVIVMVLLLKREHFKNFDQNNDEFIESIDILKKNIQNLYSHYQKLGTVTMGKK